MARRAAGWHACSRVCSGDGPKALRVTGELADGTLPYLAGPRTIEDFIVPTIGEAATAAGRPAPRVIAAVPVIVSSGTDAAVDAAKALAAEELAFYAGIPSYAKVLEHEGVDQAGELAAVGPADAVRKQLQRYLDAGATDLVLSPVRSNSADPELLWQVAASI
jgi:alkanesulfonate monooxygenase SsuD/methylene tetrahydromethanopterin reductase-like flavin-dependent oxidoreductase (luciferase family)